MNLAQYERIFLPRVIYLHAHINCSAECMLCTGWFRFSRWHTTHTRGSRVERTMYSRPSCSRTHFAHARSALSAHWLGRSACGRRLKAEERVWTRACECVHAVYDTRSDYGHMVGISLGLIVGAQVCTACSRRRSHHTCFGSVRFCLWCARQIA